MKNQTEYVNYLEMIIGSAISKAKVACISTLIFAALYIGSVSSWAITISSTFPTYSMFPNGKINAMASTADTVYIGGTFTSIGVDAPYGITIDSTAGLPAGPFPRVDRIVWTSAPDGAGGFYIGGEFTQVGATSRNCLAHILADGSVDATWNPNPNIGSYILGIVVSGSTVYVSGGFTSIGGQSRNNIAALDATTGNATSWNPNANNQVTRLAILGSTIYATGNDPFLISKWFE